MTSEVMRTGLAIALATMLAACTKTDTATTTTAAPAGDTPKTAPAAPSKPTTLPANHGEVPDAGTATQGLAMTAPEGWTKEEPSSSMRHSQYRLEGDAGDAQLVVFYFGPRGAGSVEDNLARWCGQFAQEDGRDTREVAETSERVVNGMTVHEIDVTGTYVAETSPGSGVRVNESAWRLLGAIIDTPDGPYYVKLTGPTPTVETWAESFTAFIDSANTGQ